jgi:8-oxo-dGTP pyrophosphatase MutT (NUDIX family)
MKLNTYSIPISVKGIVTHNDEVWLRKNPRGEWELPGGKLDKGEQPEETVVREIEEELGFKVKVQRLIDAHVTIIEDSLDEQDGVLVLTYLCEWKEKVSNFEIYSEGGKAEFKKYTLDEIKDLPIAQFYKEIFAKINE